MGFINEDGLDKGIFTFLIQRRTIASYWGRPLLTGDGQNLIISDSIQPITANIYIARPGQKAINCEWWGIARLTSDHNNILVETRDGLVEYAPDDCGIGSQPRRIYKDVFGSLSPDEQYSAYRQWQGIDILIREIGTGEERVVGEGMFPAWSPDGRWLTYTGRDGIYIFEIASNAVPRRIVAIQRSTNAPVYSFAPPDPSYYPPTVSWSPDGQRLVYHEFNEKLDKEFSSRPFFLQFQPRSQPYSIYKVNISTGEKIKLMDGGLNPFWRWDVEKE